MTDETTDEQAAGDEQEPPSVDEYRHGRRTARGYLAPLTDDQAAALDGRPDTEKSVDDFRHVRRNGSITRRRPR